MKFIPYLDSNQCEITLPRIEDTYIKGFAMTELEFFLEKSYKEFLFSPNINI